MIVLLMGAFQCKSLKPKPQKIDTDTQKTELSVETKKLPPTVELTSNGEGVDLYGDKLPVGALFRLGSLKMLDRSIRSLSFNGNGSMLLSNGGDHVGVWDLATIKKIRKLPRASLVTLVLPLSAPNLVLVATEKDNLVETVSTDNGKADVVNLPNKGPVISGCQKQNGDIVLGDKRGTVYLWNREKDSHTLLAASKASVVSLNCDLPGVVVWGDGHGGVFVHDGKEPKKIGKSTSPIAKVAASSEGRIVAGDTKGDILFWESFNASPRTIEGHSRITQSLCFLNEKQFISSGGDDVFRVWDTKTLDMMEERITDTELDSQYFSCSKDKNLMISWSGHANEKGSEAGRFWIWNAKDGNPLIEPERHTAGITKVLALQDNTLLTASKDGKVKSWRGDTGELLKTWALDEVTLNDLAIKNEASSKVLAASKNAQVFELSTKKESSEFFLQNTGGEINRLLISKKWQRLFTGDRTGRLWSWDIPTGTKIQAYDQNEFSSIESLALSPDDKLLAVSGSGNKVLVFDLESGKTVARLDTNESMTNYALSFSNKGTELAVGGEDMMVRIWDTSTWKQKNTLKGHDGTVRAIQYSKDDTRLASGGHDEWLLIWDLGTSAVTKKLEGHDDIITDLKWLPDQKHIVTVSEDRTGLVWHL